VAYIDFLCISAVTEVIVAKQGPCIEDLQVWHNVYGERPKSAEDLIECHQHSHRLGHLLGTHFTD
jgi:hypothetical protein